MSTKGKIVSAIDLGSSKISTLIAQVNVEPNTFEKTINIIGAASVESKGLRKGQIVNIDEVVEAAISSIEAAERMAGYNLDSAFISLGGASILSQNSHGVVAVSDPEGEIGESDVERAVEAASAVSLPSSRDLIHVIPREYIVDGEGGVKDPVGMNGVRLEVETHLITASSSSIKNIRKAVNEMGVNVDGLVFSGLAASKAVLSATEKELGCVLIEIGAGTTSIIAFVDGSVIYSGIIPVGAKNITNDLAIGLRVSLDTAEKLKILISEDEKKRKSSSDSIDLTKSGIKELKKVSKKTLSEGIIRPRLNEIFTIVKLELEKLELTAKIPSGAIISGGGAQTIGVVESAKRSLALPVRIGKPKGVGGLIDDIMNSSFSVPIGLIIYGSEQEHTEGLTSLTSKFRLPNKGNIGKLIQSIKDLLP